MAVFKQERHIELVPGAEPMFVVTNEMFSAVIPDQLPHLNVFVLTVVDEEDPKQDTLARVANLADLSLVPIGRTAGIAATGSNGAEYLSQTSTSTYDTLETATDAATAFQDRVNALIESWIEFNTAFNAPDPTPASYTLPRVDPSQKQALIDAYTLAKQDRYQKQIDKADADTALAAAQADYAYKQSLVPDLDALQTSSTKVQGELSTVISQFGVLLSAGNAFYSANAALIGIVGAPTFAAALTLSTAQQAAMATYTIDAAAHVADVAAYITARQNDVTSSAGALATAQATQITQAQALTSAQATESAALSALLIVCPDFDKNSIPFVPDTEP